MDTLELVGSNDDVGQGSAVLQDEDSALTASVFIGVAFTATVVLSVAKVAAAADGHWRRERYDAATTGWDVEGLGGGKARKGEGEGGLHGDGWSVVRFWLFVPDAAACAV